MKKQYRILFFLLGVAGIAALLYSEWDQFTKIDWAAVFSVRLVFLFLALLGLWMLIYILHARCYRIILDVDWKELPPIALLRICICGFALNNVTPAGLIGGEPYRILELRRYVDKKTATAGTLAFSLLYIMGHITFWGVNSLSYMCMRAPGSVATTVFLFIAGVVCFGLVAIFLYHRNRGFVNSSLKILAKLPLVGKYIGNYRVNNKPTIHDIDKSIVAFRKNDAKFYKVLALQFLSRVMEGLEYYIILRYFGAHVSWYQGVLVMSCASLIGDLFFFIPLQAGSRESGMSIALSFFHVAAGIQLLAGVVYRIRELICNVFGISLLLIEKQIQNREEE